MKILGLKLTHDGAICLIENGKIIFSIEIEKINNNNRFQEINDASLIEDILTSNGIDLSDIDHIVIDGWGGNDNDNLAIQPRLTIGGEFNYLSISDEGENYQLEVAQYEERHLEDNLLKSIKSNKLKIKGKNYQYSSYLHVTGHILSAYCTSPFAKINEPSYVLIWDGGMFPRLYHVDPISKKINSCGPLFLLIGNIYTIFSQHFGPFKVEGSFAKDNLSIAGKVMAYIARGKFLPELVPIFEDILNDGFEKPMGYANVFAKKFKEELQIRNISPTDEDILRTFHGFLEQILVSKLKKKISRLNYETKNLCIAGGCALNIKWNSAIRESKILENVYVPPFPNDSGSAIGNALAKFVEVTGQFSIDWSVYSGPKVIENMPIAGWKSKAFTVTELAELLHSKNEPVIVLNDKAELGPRALGNRSIIAAPVGVQMKEVLNKIKKREAYRPVSPICLEEKAIEIFEPGTRDEFMLFDHVVRKEWKSKIPAVIHEDDTARLQTVSENDNKVLYELLNEYYKLSGVPVLCNTSANYNGKGFFPDIYSATSWGGVNYVWSNDILYYKLNN